MRRVRPSPRPGALPTVADATEIAVRFAKTERLNIAASGKRFKCRFIEPGLISYKDVKGGVDLLKKETIDLCLNSMLGAVLTIDHPSPDIIRARNFTDVSHGIVDKVGYDVESGWFVCEGTVDTDAARERINNGDGVSCGFSVIEAADGGKWHNMPYDQEDTRIEFHHLAIVPPNKRARFEEADIRLNAKNTMNPVVKFIRKITGAAGAAPTEEARELPLDAKFSLGSGKTATLQEVLDAERLNAVHEVGPDDYFEHEGVRYHALTAIGHMKEHCNRMNDQDAVKKAEDEMMKKKEAEAAERANAEKTDLDRANAALASSETSIGSLKLPPGKYVLKRVENAPVETPEQKSAREATERENAAAKIKEDERIASEKKANDEKAEKERIERENATKLGREAFTTLKTAPDRANTASAVPDYSLGSGNLEDGVALGRARYGKSVVTPGRN